MRLGQKVIISLHDVMPETFRRTEEILKYLRDHRIPPITLLVVPGRQWQDHQLKRLRKLAEVGYEIAAHGWLHEATGRGGLYHHLHSMLVSRNVAEHLALNSAGIRDLMQRSHDWFLENGFPAPALYVPPAWALGPIRKNDLATLPYRHVEVLRGLIEPDTRRLIKLPMVGFEADTRCRAVAVNLWNGVQLTLARRQEKPLRISIHPEDFHLRLTGCLREMIEESYLYQNYRDIQ